MHYGESFVSVSIFLEEKNIVISISDDGGGIDPKDLPYVFDRFYKGKTGNFGLGLTIAKSAIRSLQGDIEVRNGKKGAVFKIRLPIN